MKHTRTLLAAAAAAALSLHVLPSQAALVVSDSYIDFNYEQNATNCSSAASDSIQQLSLVYDDESGVNRLTQFYRTSTETIDRRTRPTELWYANHELNCTVYDESGDILYDISTVGSADLYTSELKLFSSVENNEMYGEGMAHTYSSTEIADVVSFEPLETGDIFDLSLNVEALMSSEMNGSGFFLYNLSVFDNFENRLIDDFDMYSFSGDSEMALSETLTYAIDLMEGVSELRISLSVMADTSVNGFGSAMVDASNTTWLNMSLRSGNPFESESGVFLSRPRLNIGETDAAEVPVPGILSLLVLGLGVVARKRLHNE